MTFFVHTFMLLALVALPAAGLAAEPLAVSSNQFNLVPIDVTPDFTATNAADQAGIDFANDRCRLFLNGIQTRTLEPRSDYLQTNYHVRSVYMGCVVPPGAGTYNTTMERLLKEKYGKDVIEDANAWLLLWQAEQQAKAATAEPRPDRIPLFGNE